MQQAFLKFIAVKALWIVVLLNLNTCCTSVGGTPVMSPSANEPVTSTSFVRIPIYFQSVPIQVVAPPYDLMTQIISMMMTNMAIANQNNQTSIPNAPMTVRIIPVLNITGMSNGNRFMMLTNRFPGMPMPIPLISGNNTITNNSMTLDMDSSRPIIFPSTNNISNSSGMPMTFVD